MKKLDKFYKQKIYYAVRNFTIICIPLIISIHTAYLIYNDKMLYTPEPKVVAHGVINHKFVSDGKFYFGINNKTILVNPKTYYNNSVNSEVTLLSSPEKTMKPLNAVFTIITFFTCCVLILYFIYLLSELWSFFKKWAEIDNDTKNI